MSRVDAGCDSAPLESTKTSRKVSESGRRGAVAEFARASDCQSIGLRRMDRWRYAALVRMGKRRSGSR